MIRNLYILVLLLGCTVLSVQAKGIAPTPDVPDTKTSKKTDTKATASTTAKDKAKTPASLPTPTPNRDEANPTFAKASDKPTPAKAAPTVAKAPDKAVASAPISSRFSATAVASVRNPSISRANHSYTGHSAEGQHLARVTAYWAGEGDYYTGKCMSSTGIRLHDGHCAVDPRIIPYGSTVNIAGMGQYLAVDTGSAVISREAAKETARTPEERAALVIDVFFSSRRDGERFAASATKYAVITWSSPRSTASTQEASSVSTE